MINAGIITVQAVVAKPPQSRSSRLKEEITKQRNMQVALLRCVGAGEWDWIVISAVLFFLSDSRDFLSISGALCFVTGMIFLAPVFGIFIYLVSQLIYALRKSATRTPNLRRITHIAHALCFPAVLFLSWQMFDLFHGSYDSLVLSITDGFAKPE